MGVEICRPPQDGNGDGSGDGDGGGDPEKNTGRKRERERGRERGRGRMWRPVDEHMMGARTGMGVETRR